MRNRNRFWRNATHGTLASLLVWSALSVTAGGALAEPAGINVTLDGSPLPMPVAPVNVAGRTLVSVRYVAEAVGATVDWNPATQQVAVNRGADRILLTLGQPSATVNGQPMALDVSPQLMQDRTMVPLRFVAEALGLFVAWDQGSQTVAIRHDEVLQGIQLQGSRSAPVVSIATTARPIYRAFTLDNPHRAVIDLPNTQLQPGVPVVQNVDGPVLSRVRLGHPDSTTTRVVLDMNGDQPFTLRATDAGLQVLFASAQQPGSVQVTAMPGKVRLTFPAAVPAGSTVTLLPDGKTLDVALPTGGANIAPQGFTFDDGAPATVQAISSTHIAIALPYYLGHSVVAGNNLVVDVATSPLYQRRIWIDAGHGQVPGGANDPGATGTTYRVNEKQINLAVALALKTRLETAGATVYMTRTGDVGVNYTDRPKLVNSVTPGIEAFVSIHHNSLPSIPSLHGVETYYWNPQSKALAGAVHQAVVSGLAEPDHGVRVYDYYVVKYTQAPAILVELGYLSNPAEEKAMTDAGYSAKSALALQKGLANYFQGVVQSPGGTSPGTPEPTAPQPWQAGETAVVSTGADVLNLRQGPGTSYPIVTTLKDGALATVLEVSGNWAHVSAGGATGYVAVDYLAHQQ